MRVKYSELSVDRDRYFSKLLDTLLHSSHLMSISTTLHHTTLLHSPFSTSVSSTPTTPHTASMDTPSLILLPISDSTTSTPQIPSLNISHLTHSSSYVRYSALAVGMYPHVKSAVDKGEVLLEWDYSKGACATTWCLCVNCKDS